jgi:hypothetical protein
LLLLLLLLLFCCCCCSLLIYVFFFLLFRCACRILVSCPVPGRPAWSFFGVCDGHGGSFSSNFLANTIPPMLTREAALLARYLGSSYLPGGTSNDSDTTPQLLTDLLAKICADADSQLSQQPRMLVEQSGGAGTSSRLKYTVMDGSGSTAIFALVTSQYVAVANVGDSRAVLAQRSAATRSSASSSVHNPFSGTPSSTPRNSFTLGNGSSSGGGGGGGHTHSAAHNLGQAQNASVTPVQGTLGASSSFNALQLAAAVSAAAASSDTGGTGGTSSPHRTPPPAPATHLGNHSDRSGYCDANQVGFSFATGDPSSSVLDSVGLSRDHKITIPEERARVEAAGAT